MEAVFNALGSPARRLLLDSLFEQDGQSLGELTDRLDMSRFGTAKHLGQLEEAGLVVTRRSGREKLHYLNPVPIRELHDRWISKYSGAWVSTLTSLKRDLETEVIDTMSEDRHLFQIYIRATPEQVWDGITSGALTRRYFHETTIDSTWEPGAPVAYRFDDGRVAVEGEVLEVDRPRRLSYTWHVLYNEAAAEEAPSRVTWELEQVGEATKLTLVHDQFPEGSVVYPEVGQGWQPLLSSLKSLLETGEPLNLAEAESSTGGTASPSGRSSDVALNPRQLEVLRLVADGQTDVTIGSQLAINPRTIARHLANIIASLGVQSRAEAVARARQLGLL